MINQGQQDVKDKKEFQAFIYAWTSLYWTNFFLTW
jgi:hypothetical protein